MKRFHSNLQKVHDICHQQSRMAELELARARSLLIIAQQNVQLAVNELEQAREEVNRALKHTRQSSLILGMHQHLGAAGDRVQQREHECQKAAQACELARVKYQEAHSKVERIARLIEKQQTLHRRDVLLDQQRAMDDVAIFRWREPEQSEIEVSTHG